MKIVSIEPTPSPHSMKINVDEALVEGDTHNYQIEADLIGAPDFIHELMKVKGVKGLYHVFDFITIQRHPKVKWEAILPEIRTLLGTTHDMTDDFQVTPEVASDHFGEVKVFVHMFRRIPMEVMLDDGESQQRYGLPMRFSEAVIAASTMGENLLQERKWIEQSTRYGDLDDIGDTVVEELKASYDAKRLQKLVSRAIEGEAGSADYRPINAIQPDVTLAMLDQSSWKDRYAALDQIIEPTVDNLPVLDKALNDEKASVRRLSTALLGMIEEKAVLPSLYRALQDTAVNVRRTAGDCLSDLGFKEAMPHMIATLFDKNRLVRWRATMFLYETGDESAVRALKGALDDPEFEVRMQVKMALNRIEAGQTAEGSIWKQMAEATKDS